MARKLRSALLLMLLFLIVAGTAQAAIPTPPLADDANLTLRFSFDNYDFSSFENSLDGWTVGGTGSYSYDFVSSWTTHGSYSLKLTTDVAGNNVQSVYIEKTLSFTANVITFDYKLVDNPDGGEKLTVYCDGTEAWDTTTAGSGSAYVKCSGTTIKIQLGASVAGSATAYIDNVRVFNAEDDSGNGNDGQIYGATSVEGRYGYGLSFDGTDYVKVLDSESLNITSGGITVAAWVYPTKTDAAQYIVEKYSVSAGFRLFIRAANIWGYGFVGDSDTIDASGNEVDFNTWNFVVITYDYNTKTARIYVNGELQGETTKDVGIIDTSGLDLYIGSSNGDAAFFGGIIDEVRIYNRSLSDSEIQQMYEALRVKFYDESSGEKIAANATVFNANYSIDLTTDEVTKEVVLFNADLPESGEYIVTVESSDYYPRTYIVELTGDYAELNTYLPSKSSSVIYNSITLEDLTGKYKPEQVIISLRNPTASNDPVFESYFDSSGKVGAYLLLDRGYIVDLITPTETISKGWIYPDTSGTITVRIGEITLSPVYTALQKDISYEFKYEGGAVSLIYNDTTSTTTSITLKVLNQTGSTVYENTVNASNAVITFDTSGLNDSYVKALLIAHSTKYGTIKAGKIIFMNDLSGPNLSTGLETKVSYEVKNLFFAGFIIVLAFMFGYKDSYKGAIIITLVAALLTYAKLLDIPVSSITLAMSYAILAYLGKSAKEWEGWG